MQTLPGIWESSLVADVDLLPTTKTRTRTERPKLYKVIVLNDDLTPADLVMAILR
jgi:ATP-dependent Clp protease adaptor protein ClpS